MEERRRPRQADEQYKPHKWLVTITVMMATLMGALDMSIVNVALPHIRGSLGASVEEIAWVSTGYMLSNVIIMPLIALLSSRFGRKRFYLFSVALFTCLFNALRSCVGPVLDGRVSDHSGHRRRGALPVGAGHPAGNLSTRRNKRRP